MSKAKTVSMLKNMFSMNSILEKEEDTEKLKEEIKSKKINRPTKILDFGDQKVSFVGNDESALNSQVVFFKPNNLDDCVKIGEWIAREEIVILNFEDLDCIIGQRIVDFVVGALFVTSGQLISVGKNVQCCVPKAYRAVIDMDGDVSGNDLISSYSELVEEIKPRYQKKA